jgi:EAL domain-containing protein (putative c-di-GMP-specific phosphodiesterase class I)
MSAGTEGAVATRIRALLDGLREDTGVDLVYLGRFTDGEEQLRLVAGGHPRLRLYEGDRSPLEASFCWRIPQGIIPRVIRHTALEPGVATLLGRDNGIGGYVSMPVYGATGDTYGTICCITNSALDGDGNEILRVVETVSTLVQPLLGTFEVEHAAHEHVGAPLRRFIATHDVGTVFQPIVDMATGETRAYESLSRFSSDPAHGPDWWLEVAHGLEVGLDLEMAMLKQALSTAGRADFAVPITLNASPALLQSGALLPILDSIDTGTLGIEVTEHAVVRDYEQLLVAVAALKERGHLVFIDDAGAGFASFRHVLELDPDAVKLDISLTRNIDQDATRHSLAAALYDFASRQGIRLVVEGVETEAEAQCLRQLGYQYAQGYLFGRPAPASEFPTPVLTGVDLGVA